MFQMSMIGEKAQKSQNIWVATTLFFLVNHLMTPQTYVMSLWRGLTLDWEPVKSLTVYIMYGS